MKNRSLVCVGCGGTFSLTGEGEKMFKEHKLDNPIVCKQCNIIFNRNKGIILREKVPTRTNSTFWTEKRIKEYERKLLEQSNGLYTNNSAKGFR
jgi:hypothetical protein